MKTCNRCAAAKPLEEFFGNSATKDRKHRWCKACCRETAREYYRKTREWQIQKVRHWQKHRHDPDFQSLRRRKLRDPELQRRYRNGLSSLSVKGVKNELSYEEFVARFTGPCFYCGAPSKELDHLLPVSLGGRHNAVNTVGSCYACNRKKQNWDVVEFAYRQQRLDWLQKVPAETLAIIRELHELIARLAA